jgi:hypothetical protein
MPKGDGTAVLRVQVPARVEADLLDAVRAEARKHRRSLGQELATMIEESLKARGIDPAAATAAEKRQKRSG